jgi:cell wall-associated NlpC family hydrolase
MVKVYKKVNKKIKLSTQIEKYAKKMLGKKYVWGATGPTCYDCSGFTQKVYRKIAGVKLPRVSYLQAKVGKRISFKKLKQGDMVFFDTEKKRTGKVNHVGIYLRNGNFIHASSGGKKVMITNFNKKRFYKNRFLWGRRILKEQANIAMLPSNTKKSL